MKTALFTPLFLALAMGVATTPTHAGSVARLIYDGVTGSSVSALTNASIFPGSPTFREQLDDFTLDPFGEPVFGLQGKDNSFIDFGSWVRGYLEAPADGNFVFFIASDDASELWLSTNHVSANALLVAFESGSGTPLFSGPRLAERSSVPLALKRGEKYYFEVRHKQDSGTSKIEVGWQRPDGTQEIIPALHLAQHPIDAYLGRTDPDAVPFFNPSGLNGGDLLPTANVSELGSLLLEVDVIAAQPTTFQWLSNGVSIPGENLSFLRWSEVPFSAHGAEIQVIVSNSFGTLTSAATALTVTPDATPLDIALVDHRGNPNGLRVTYTKPVNPVTATNLANYALNSGSLAIHSATLLSDGVSVQLGGSFNFQLNNQYVLTVQNVEDTAAIPNGLSPNPTEVTVTFAGVNIGPVGFSLNLTNLSLLENRPAHLEVIPSGATPFTYQWLYNGEVISNETNNTFDFVAAFLTAGNYQVIVSNEFSHATSATAQLTVEADLIAPQLVAIRGLAGTIDEVRLTFDEPLDADSANNPATYSLGFVPVLSATLSADGLTVTLRTGGLLRDQVYLLTINGLKDRAFAGNTLNVTASFVAEVDYVGEVLVDGLVRFWRFDEASGSSTVGSLVSVRDALDSTPGTLSGGPALEVPGLLPNEPGNSAIQFIAAQSQRINVPNGSDLNATAGPWAKKSFEFWFRANSVPAPGTTGLGATAGIWEQGAATRALSVYLWRDPANSNPAEAALVFHAANNASDGVGSPFGASSGLATPAVYVQATIQTGVVYHVVAVFDGDATGTNGNLILYLNGVEVARTGGVGQIYNHTGDIQIGRGGSIIHTGQNGAYGFFDGVLDDLSLYNRALPPNRVAVHYRSGALGSDTTDLAPAVTRVDTRGNPNQLLVTFNKPISAESANNLANFSLRRSDESAIAILNSILLAGDRTVSLTGNFDFLLGSNYVLTVSNVTDQATPPNWLAPNPTNVAFSFATPSSAFYSFDTGLPNDLQVYGSAGVTSSGSYDGSGYLRLTDATNNQNGYALFTERRDTDQFHLRFKARLSDTSLLPADGFSVNLAADLPTATFGTPEEGYLPAATISADRLIVSFDNFQNNSGDFSPSIAVKWQGVELINVLTGTNGIPTLHNNSGAWVNVEIQLKRGGKITVIYDGVTVIDQFPTGFDLLPHAQLGLAARTGGSYETHWFDDISINYSDGDAGPVGISPDSELADVVAGENQIVRFAVVATGAGPFRYQWYHDGTPVIGGNTRVLELVATTSIIGNYHAVVQNEFSQVTSSAANLSVDTDAVAPSVEHIEGLAGSLNEIRVWFDEPVNEASATNLANYSAGTLQLFSATLSADGQLVILKTAPQTFQQNYSLQIFNIRDRSASGNFLNVEVPFVATVSYTAEVLADQPVRYWRLGETLGASAASLVSELDPLATTSASFINSPALNQPALVPNTTGDGAVRLRSSSSQRITVPNGADLNTTSGPWEKKSVEFWFNASSVPAPGTTGVGATAGLFEQGAGTRGLAIYLWRDPANANPAEAELVFHAWNNAAGDGPGSPFGAPGIPIYLQATITTGVTYHVVAVFDGGTDLSTGQLVLYLNGVEVGRTTGVGRLYNHTGDIQIGRGNTILHTATTTTAVTPSFFDGVLDEFSLYNSALSASRVASHYQVGATSVAVVAPVIESIRVENGHIVIRWNGEARLEAAPTPSGPYVEVVGAISPFQVIPQPDENQFYRLVQ